MTLCAGSSNPAMSPSLVANPNWLGPLTSPVRRRGAYMVLTVNVIGMSILPSRAFDVRECKFKADIENVSLR